MSTAKTQQEGTACRDPGEWTEPAATAHASGVRKPAGVTGGHQKVLSRVALGLQCLTLPKQSPGKPELGKRPRAPCWARRPKPPECWSSDSPIARAQFVRQFTAFHRCHHVLPHTHTGSPVGSGLLSGSLGWASASSSTSHSKEVLPSPGKSTKMQALAISA